MRGYALRPSQRQRQRELAASPGRAFNFNMTAVSVRDVLDQRQTEPTSLCVVHQRIARAVELLKNPGLVVAIDTDATIDDFQLQLSVGPI